MIQEYNKSPISLREGKVFIDGVEVMDSIKCDITFTPEVWSGKQLGERTNSSRWLGYAIAGTITRRRSTPWIKDVIKQYRASGKTPEFKIQGLMNDENSDYYSEFGSDTITVVSAVLASDANADTARGEAVEAIQLYLKELALATPDGESLVVRISTIGALLYAENSKRNPQDARRNPGAGTFTDGDPWLLGG